MGTKILKLFHFPIYLNIVRMSVLFINMHISHMNVQGAVKIQNIFQFQYRISYDVYIPLLIIMISFRCCKPKLK